MSQPSPPGKITVLLERAADGDAEAKERLWSHVYPELKSIAHRELRRRRVGDTQQTTALVHEAYIKLFDKSEVDWNDRNHFFALAATAMRQILVDYARKKVTAKRGGGKRAVALDERLVVAEARAQTFLDLHRALTELFKLDERLGRVVEYRFFGGMTEDEIASVLGLAKRTVQRDWRTARAWLAANLNEAS